MLAYIVIIFIIKFKQIGDNFFIIGLDWSGYTEWDR
jgi:hypothetical protein